ncbi:MAG: tetratricopeptide repeat protein [Candidatus Obscuribacterales bacterium]|nr:tetratricopeptide repeat protein [Candidatus Obscuribacterales bacterium]
MFKSIVVKRSLAFGLLVASLFSMPVYAATVTDTNKLKEIDEQIERGHVNKDMLAQVQAIIGREPHLGLAHYVAGRLLAYFGYSDLAEQEFVFADQFDPEHSAAVLQLFDLRMQNEELARAYQLLEFIAKRFPEEPSLLMMQGIFLERSGKTAEAEKIYLKALQNPKKITGVSTALAQVRLQQGKPEEAIKLAKVDLQHLPAHFMANVVIGEALLSLNRPLEAIPYIEKAHQVRPANYDLIRMMALAYYRAHDFERALPCALLYMTLSTKAPQFANAKLFCAKIIHNLSPKDVDKGINEAAEVLSDKDYRVRLHLSVGDVLDRMSRHIEAARQFALGLRLDPHNARGWYRLAVDEEIFGLYDQSIVSFKRALDLDPRDREIHAGAVRLATRLMNQERDVAWRLKESLRR